MNVKLYDGTARCADHMDSSQYEGCTSDPCLYCTPRSATVTFPADTFTPDMLKALSVTGRIATVSGKFQAKILCVEGINWSTLTDGDTVTLDHHTTPLPHLAEPSVYYIHTYQDEWDGEIYFHHGWATLSHVSKGVCLVKS